MADFFEDVPIIIRECVGRLNDDSPDVLKANHKTLAALSKHVPAEELVNHVEYMRNLIATLVSDARRRKGGVGDGEFFLPGFNMPKGKYKLTKQTRRRHRNEETIVTLSRLSSKHVGCKRLVFLIMPALASGSKNSKVYTLTRVLFVFYFRLRSRTPTSNFSTRDIIWCAIRS